MGADVEIVRDLLDSQVIDREKMKMGRIDGIVLSFDDDGRPRIDHLELGFAAMARRIHPRVESWLRVVRRWSVRRSAVYHVPWEKVIDLSHQTVQIDVKAEETPAFDWERWLAKHLVNRIPGGGKA